MSCYLYVVHVYIHTCTHTPTLKHLLTPTLVK